MKFPYQETDIVESDGFEISEYINRDQYRKAKKEERGDEFGRIMKIIQDSAYTEICELEDYVIQNEPDLLSVLIEKHHAFDSSIRSRARMCHLKNSLIERIDTLEHDNEVLRRQYYQTKEDFQNLKKGDLELRRYVLEVAALADRVQDAKAKLILIDIGEFEKLDSN